MVNNQTGRLVAYNGVCLICGSTDGMVIKCEDERHRVICRVCSCPAHYKPAPAVGYEFLEQAQDRIMGYNALTGGNDQVELTYGKYLYGFQVKEDL